MSKEVVKSFSGQFKRVSNFYEKFIETCPDKIWASLSGRFPVWQHVYHALECVPFFLGPKDAPQRESLYSIDVMKFKDLSQPPADKAKLTALAKEMSAYAQKFFDSLNDEDLGKEHAGFSSRRNMSLTNADAITILIGHNYYHFGNCDAALRANGLEGLF